MAQGPYNQALGLWYAGEKFSPEAKADVEAKVATMIDVYKSRLQTADWLAPETREKAITKLNVITPHIGYPEKLPETYDKEIIDENLSLVENAQKLVEISIAHSWSKWNKPVDRSEWHMPAHMVNAYYDPQQNQIVFPAAILQAPFYDLHQSSSLMRFPMPLIQTVLPLMRMVVLRIGGLKKTMQPLRNVLTRLWISLRAWILMVPRSTAN